MSKKRLTLLPKRHTHSTIAAFEDTIAILNDVLFELSETLKYTQARLSQAREKLIEARKGPHAYDPETPSGVRVQIRRKGKG